tara:strand:- start:16158 stop:17063 length:906 start_codon:yes stop_codon:yes gene_type:complete
VVGNHDTLVYRLAQILIKLNQGEKLDPRLLADEFGVTLRTVQRDLNVRFACLPLQKTEGLYHMEPIYLGKLNNIDIQNFARLAGVSGLFPPLSNDFLRDIFDSHLQSALLVKGHNYENLDGKEVQFKQLEQAIVGNHHVSFDYNKDNGIQHYNVVAPYKLINNKGIWYLAGLDDSKLKTFSFSKITNLQQLETKFTSDPEHIKMLNEEDGVWLSNNKKEIVLNISKDVANYFKRRKLIANQVIEKELEDGGLIVSAKVGHINQVLPIVRYWLPHIRIVSPDGLQKEMEGELLHYIKQTEKP